MLRIGLTGGIGSGKSAVAKLFRELGIQVLDADQIGRELVEPGQPALNKIVERFGPDILSTDGRLNRDRLRQLVLADSRDKAWLESLLHPRIQKRREQLIAESNSAYVVLEIPLLVERNLQELVDRILVIDVPVELQIDRTMKRSGLSRTEVEAIIAHQVSRESRLSQATEVIDNSGDLNQLRQQVEALHARFLELANPA